MIYLKKFSSSVLFIIFLFLVLLDQVTKTVFSFSKDFGFFAITPITNTGMSFGLFQGNNFAFILISLLFIFLIFLFRKEFKGYEIFLVMILAGAVGNLIDRLIHGHVLDFINFKFFPVFNVADSLIFVGVACIIFLEFKKSLNFKKSKKN